MCVGTHDRAPDDAARRGHGGKGGDAIDWDRRPAKDLAIEDDGEGTDDAAGNLGKRRRGEVRGMEGRTRWDSDESGQSLTDRVVTLGARKEIDRGLKVVLGYEAIV